MATIKVPIHSNTQGLLKLCNIASRGSFIALCNFYRPINTCKAGFIAAVGDSKLWGAISDKRTPMFPKFISEIQYTYRMSDIYIRHPISISDFQYLYPTSDIYIRRPISISEARYLYPSPDIYIRRPKSIFDVRYTIPDFG